MTLARVNTLNIALMALSCAVAWFLPFELFIFSYAVLGPLHYLTEISWLHDRQYFTTGKKDALVLVLGCVPIVVIALFEMKSGFEFSALVIWVFFWSAFGMAFLNKTMDKVMVGFGALLIGLALWEGATYRLWLGAFFPTIVHVCIFTAAFIFYGALKSKSTSGYLSLTVFLLCGSVFFWDIPSAASYLPSDYVTASVQPFGGLIRDLLGLFSLGSGWDDVTAIMRFIAYIYTYHYLNWFSKTKVIGWHDVSRKRLVGVFVSWVALLLVYAIDYERGILVLGFLSLAHVFLEFPLNFRSFNGIFREIRSRLIR